VTLLESSSPELSSRGQFLAAALQQEDLPQTIRMLLPLQRDPSCLELGSRRMRSSATRQRRGKILSQIRALGVGIAIDGFGTIFDLAYITGSVSTHQD